MDPEVLQQLGPTLPQGSEIWALGDSPGVLPKHSPVSPRPPVCAHTCCPGAESSDLGCTPAGPGCLLEEPLARRHQDLRPSSAVLSLARRMGPGSGVSPRVDPLSQKGAWALQSFPCLHSQLPDFPRPHNKLLDPCAWFLVHLVKFHTWH